MCWFILHCTTAAGAAGTALHRRRAGRWAVPGGSPCLCMEREPDVQHLEQHEFCLTQLVCLSPCSAKSQVFYGRTNSKHGVRLSALWVLLCPLEEALPRQLEAVSSAQTKNPPGSGWHKGSLYVAFQTHYIWDTARFPWSSGGWGLRWCRWRNWQEAAVVELLCLLCSGWAQAELPSLQGAGRSNGAWKGLKRDDLWLVVIVLTYGINKNKGFCYIGHE